MEPTKILVHHLVIPSMEKGWIGFCKEGERSAFEPNYRYVTKGGAVDYIHINSQDQLYEFAIKIGAMPPNKFREHYGFRPKENWNDYSWYFDRAVERALILTGIEFEIHHQKLQLIYRTRVLYIYLN
jgi:hypothetical protein